MTAITASSNTHDNISILYEQPSEIEELSTPGKKSITPLAHSKCAILALVISCVVGMTLIGLGTTRLFGPVDSVGFIGSLAGGGVLTAVSGFLFIWILISNCKKEQTPSEITHAKTSSLLKLTRDSPQIAPKTQTVSEQAKTSSNFPLFEVPPPIPQTIPPGRDIREKWTSSNWVTNSFIHDYFLYLASRYYPQVTIPFAFPDISLNEMEYHIHTLNQKTTNYQKTNYAFFLSVCDNHWMFVYINRTKRTVEYYDSKRAYGGFEYSKIVNELTRIAALLTEEEPGDKPFKLELKITKLLQPDSYQCGIWVMYFFDNILKDQNVDFNKLANPQKTIEAFRIETMHRMIQVDGIIKKAQDEHLNAYKEFYHDPTHSKNELGQERYQRKLIKDNKKINPIARWNLYLQDKHPNPGSNY